MDEQNIWQVKLHARLHDPAEKALVLLRDPAGHEGGTSRALHRLLGFQELPADTVPSDDEAGLHGTLFKQGVPRAIYDIVRRADQWSAAADRPQWPMQEITVQTINGATKTLKFADWSQVRWTKEPVLIHPLTGEEYDLGRNGGLADSDFHDIKARSLAHFADLVVRDGDRAVDWRRTLLALWRFGPELREIEDFGKLGALWRLLPADTRVPDHSIWDHLDLASAFAGAAASAADGDLSLLAISIGPVQPFIASARSTSDLWAGSHLLARLAWETMRPVCEELGPDAILFPRLRGVPQVDLWLRDDCGVAGRLFEDCEWTKGSTDANPLFSAALPNRFVAVVPAAQAADLAARVEESVRVWLADLGKGVIDRLLKAAGIETDTEASCCGQMREQLAGFPEVHWAAVPFSLIRETGSGGQRTLDVSQLSAAMAPFFGIEPGTACGFLDTPAWKVLQRETRWSDDTTFFTPNPGVLYPAVYDLAERVLAAAKSVRPFDQLEQRGWRCSLTGETEWLTTEPTQLDHSYRQQKDTLWSRIAERCPAWAKPGEHLGALPAIKRLWPTLFAEEVRGAVGGDLRRFVVSTHSMALAYQLDHWLETAAVSVAGLAQAMASYDAEAVALPRRLVLRHQRNAALEDAKRLAGLLERARELDDAGEFKRLETLVKQTLSGTNREQPRIESYYGLLLMDGDRMGAWLSGDDNYATSYERSFHPRVRKGFKQRAAQQPLLAQYGEQRRALSPNRHLAISGALNDFALTVVRHVVEREFLGRVIYAGGDDVLAMLPVADLLPAMQRLRDAYSGRDSNRGDEDQQRLALGKGFALLDNRLMRMMGGLATASCGAVIAHHQAPLGMVLRELRQAESRAKNEGGRDAFSLTLIKRSGGSLRLTAGWDEPVSVLLALRDFLADPAVSRRAVYNSLQWLHDLPPPEGDGSMLTHLLDLQLARQTENKAAIQHHDLPGLVRRLTALTLSQAQERLDWLANFLIVAEFLARQGRVGTKGTNNGPRTPEAI